jgi:hypothetical protein
MHKYCKAYHLKDLRSFASWKELPVADGDDLTEDAVVYLWDDFTVVKSPVLADQGTIWNNVTPEWELFCKEVLQFEIPEDVRYAYEQPQ